jgi:hypothetical protein
MYTAIVFLPLLGFLIVGSLGRSLGPRQSEIVTTGLLAVSAVLSWIAFINVGLGSAPATTPVLIGRLVSHWAPLAEGETKMTQVCQQIIQPLAPEGAKAKRGKKPKLPPPFTLSLAVTIELV